MNIEGYKQGFLGFFFVGSLATFLSIVVLDQFAHGILSATPTWFLLLVSAAGGLSLTLSFRTHISCKLIHEPSNIDPYIKTVDESLKTLGLHVLIKGDTQTVYDMAGQGQSKARIVIKGKLVIVSGPYGIIKRINRMLM